MWDVENTGVHQGSVLSPLYYIMMQEAHTKSANTRCGVNQKVLMERQDVVLSRMRYLRMVWSGS